MSVDVTVTIPDEVLQRAEILASRVGRPVADLLAETIELSLRPLGNCSTREKSLESLSDEEVLAGSAAELPAAADERLSGLLYRQQTGLLTAEERTELTVLMQTYQDGLLRKAQALREAVRRGLREPLQP